MTHNWLISGAARSGTSALYEALQGLSIENDLRIRHVYEPYLWGPPTWNRELASVTDRFAHTSSIHALGLAAHLTTPLFADSGDHPLNSQLIDTVFGDGKGALVKEIRGSGRLGLFLRRVPDLKIILMIRNPLDNINSILGLFSFFGDEFFPSDRARFFQEIGAGKGGRPEGPAPQPESLDALAWWKHMNAAALAIAEQFPDRTLVVPHEYYVENRAGVLRAIAGFLDVPFAQNPMRALDAAAGPITPHARLGKADVEALEAATADYFDQLPQFADRLPKIDVPARSAKARSKYKSRPEGYFSPEAPRDIAPLTLRQMASSLSSQLSDLHAAAEALQLQLKEKDHATHSLSAAAQDLHQQLEEKDQAIHSLNDTAQNLQQQLEEKERAIHSLNATGQNLQQQLEEKDRTIHLLSAAAQGIQS